MQEHHANLIERQGFGTWVRLTLHAPSLADLQPGQYVALRCALDASYDPLVRVPLWPLSADPRTGTLSLLVASDDPAHAFLAQHSTDTPINVLGPLGHGWQLASSTRTLALIGTTTHAAALFGLAQHAVERGVAVSLTLGANEPDAAPPPFLLPADAEYNVASGHDPAQAALALLDDTTVRWADMVAVALPFEVLSSVAQRVRSTRLNWSENMVQALLLPPPVCHVGVCGVCNVPTRQGYKLACVDGPVFDLKQVVAYG